MASEWIRLYPNEYIRDAKRTVEHHKIESEYDKAVVEHAKKNPFAVVEDLKGERIPVFKAGKALKSVMNISEVEE